MARFQVTLKGYKGIAAQPDEAAGRDELLEYLGAGYPVYAAVEGERCLGYLVCRVEEPCVWVESLAASYGEETLYFNVHPNHHGMMAFLRRHGDTVLNLVEIRRPYRSEQLSATIWVGEYEFDY